MVNNNLNCKSSCKSILAVTPVRGSIGSKHVDELRRYTLVALVVELCSMLVDGQRVSKMKQTCQHQGV